MLHKVNRVFCCAGLIGLVAAVACAQPTKQPVLDTWIQTAAMPGSYHRVLSYGVVRPDTQRTRPPLKTGHLIGQYAGGLVGGVLLGGVAGVGGYILLSGNVVSCDDGFCELGILAVTVAAGFTLGSAVGVQAVGGTRNQQAPFLATLGGSTLGMVLTLVAISGNEETNTVEEWLYLSMPTFGAMIAFNALRRYREHGISGEAALLREADGSWRLGMPLVTRQPDPLTLGQTTAYQMRLLRVAF